MTSPTQKGEREEALRIARMVAESKAPLMRASNTSFHDIVMLCNALLSSSKAEGGMREALEALRTALLPDAMAKEKGALTAASRERCMAIVKRALSPKESA